MQFRPKKIDYTTPAGASGGPGVAAQIPWYGGTPYINMSTAVYSGVQQAIGASLGDIWWLGGGPEASGGNAFMFVRARAALAIGQLVTFQTPTTGQLTVPGLPVSTAASITTNVSNAAAGVNGEVGNYIFVSPAATYATIQLRRIKANTAAVTGNFTVAQTDFLRPNNPTDQDVFDGFSVFANADPLSIIRPYNVIVNTASTVPVGVALGTVTSGNYTIIQVAGLCPVLTKGDTANKGIVTGQPLVGGAAGVAQGQLDNAATEYVKYGLGSNITALYTSTAASLILPCYVNFTGV
jgi:hypothetical protein